MSLKSTFKGFLGETVINVAMLLKLDKEIYHRLNNVTLPLSNGGSTQIDHVIVSVYGIFVIETKNYKGWIYGSENQRQWTQAFPNGRKYKFQNPLRQNYLHIKTLANLLELDTSYFHSMIAFIGECELKTRDELPEHVLTNGMASYVKKKQDKLLTEAEVKSIVEQIESNRFSKSWKTNSQHKAYLKDKHNNPNKQPTDKPKNKLVAKAKAAPEIKTAVKSREVLRWSGQTEVEQPNSPIVPSSNVQLSSQLNNDDSFFITPFEVLESEPKIKESSTKEPCIIEQVEASIVSDNAPACPRCHSEMIKRVAKKGARAEQAFYGCSQFPKCRGVVNVN
ncbi:NERD domain-containing protein [Psychrobacter sp. P11G5]|uniref:nuclease-related domain-containing protein n=1 Tax=Psychrobacter sp. P11G5 TaxID=1699624 RepID=UPI00078D4650|nr:NERD domain-containing protein [Psychrobacter sp. P11G5]AMN67965.1 DNA topoisomerase I [Psychrobacter sp. P11G5]